MSACGDHVCLFVEGSDGTESVSVRRLADGDFEVLYTPGFVEGIAAGDVIRVLDPARGAFEIVRRGGNLSVKLIHVDGIRPALSWLGSTLLNLGARVDGQTQRMAVLTVPVSAGFAAVESGMTGACTAFPGLVWYYGNVYDAEGHPLNWWFADSRGHG